MTKEQLDALFAMKSAFPNMSWAILEGGVLRIDTWLTEGQAKFLLDAQQMMS